MKEKGEIPKSTRNRTPEHDKMLLCVRRYQSFVKLKTTLTLQIKAMTRNGQIDEKGEEEYLSAWAKPLDKIKRMEIKGAAAYLKNTRVWTEWLQHVRGIGETLAVQFIAILNPISDFDTVSKVWAYAGQHVIDGKAARRSKGTKSNWDPELKCLCFQLAECFVKAGGSYRVIYDLYKASDRSKHPEPVERLGKDNKKVKDYTDGHMHKRAMRYAAKMFLSHLWQVWREFEGLPVREPYPIAFLPTHTKIISPWSCVEIPAKEAAV